MNIMARGERLSRETTKPGASVCFSLALLLLVACSTSASTICDLPDYSHRGEAAKTWLTSQLKHQTVPTISSRRWSKLGRVTAFPTNEVPINVDMVASASEAFVRWIHGDEGSKTMPSQKLSIVPMEMPGFKSEESSLHLTWIVEQSLREGETLIEFPLDLCLSDASTAEGTMSLQGAPWEVRLATKLLRERFKGSVSGWAPYMKLLPDFVFLPLFFSELELKNIQDVLVIHEVHNMRRFVEAAFNALRTEETGGAKFTEFAWALAIVYSSACHIAQGDFSTHLIIPFQSSLVEPHAKVDAVYVNGHIRLVTKGKATKGMFLSAAFGSSTAIDLFLFRGLVPSNPNIRVQLFTNLLDLVDWYVSTYGAVNNNKYLTLKLARDAKDVLASQLLDVNATSSENRNTGEADFFLSADGHMDPRIVCIFTTLSYAKELLEINGDGDVHQDSITTYDMDIRISTPWAKKLDLLVKEFSARDALHPLSCDTVLLVNSNFRKAVSLAVEAVRWRLQSLLDSFSTTLEEDDSLSGAALWEGFSGTGVSQSACASCRWQIEEMSFNDNLAVQYRSSRKTLLQQFTSRLSCSSSKSEESVPAVNEIVGPNIGNTTVEEFLNWCKGKDFTISGKLAVTYISAGEGEQILLQDGDLVRGVVALKTIQQGETLCNLPLNMGLYDNETAIASEVDGWDRAAARLLREKAKGNSSSWAPYIAVLPTQMSSPIFLEAHEMEEVQWWPLIRELVQVRKSIRESFALLKRADVAWADFEEYNILRALSFIRCTAEWAAMMVHSRAFTLPVKEDEQYAPYVMMPYMDIINHHYQYQADWISQPIWDGKLEIIAKRQIKKGQQLFASFGPRSNDNLFLYYGFVLVNNPFDSAQIFDSYEGALRWFLELWSSSCEHQKEHRATYALCKRRRWERHWKTVKQALEDVPGGGVGQNKDWWDLIGHWADYGYQYIPYQPGPTIYARGVIDPSLLTAFAAVANIVQVWDNDTKLHSALHFSSEDSMNSQVSANNGSSMGSWTILLKGLFLCMEDHITELPNRSLVKGHPCWDSFLKVYSAEAKPARPSLLARISTSFRCLQVLASFPTTIDQDRLLLDQYSSRCGDSLPCPGSLRPSEHLQLTARYRYLKNYFLRPLWI